eukprot:Sdes_comp19784_c0_seq2m11852
MGWLFGSSKTPQELLRQNQRSLNKAMREMDRERMKLEQQEKKLILDIKKNAKAGQIDATKIMAKDLVRTRNYVKKFHLMKTNIQAVSLRIQTLRSNQAMAEAMKGVTHALKSMNKKMKLPQIQKIMMDFEKESEIMDMKEEMISETIDDVMEGDEDEEETEQVVNQVLDELGLGLDQSLVNTPLKLETEPKKQPKVALMSSGQPSSSASSILNSNSGGSDADLQARLDNLRRD